MNPERLDYTHEAEAPDERPKVVNLRLPPVLHAELRILALRRRMTLQHLLLSELQRFARIHAVREVIC